MPENLFQKNGYLFVPNLIEIEGYFAIMQKMLSLGKGAVDSRQLVLGAINFYKEPIFEKILEHLLPQIEEFTGYELYKTYSYARLYNKGVELKPHRDRKACEVTVSLALGGEIDKWPIWVEGREGQAHQFLLKPGDALIFKGIELKHWRNENTFGPCTMVFFHYVDKNGPYADQKDDLSKKEDTTTY